MEVIYKHNGQSEKMELSDAMAQFEKRLNHIIIDDADVKIPTSQEIDDFFNLAKNTDNLETIGNRKLQNTYFKRNEVNNYFDASNWASLQEISDFFAGSNY